MKFSHENTDQISKELVGQEPIMYSYISSSEAGAERNRAIGIQYQVARKLKHADFFAQLNNRQESRLVNTRIRSKLHNIYTLEFKTLDYAFSAINLDCWSIESHLSMDI